MNKYPLPSDDRLEELIRDSFENTQGPDMVRLRQLEQRLIRTTNLVKPRRKLNSLPWWIILLLAGGLATAAWWAGEQWLESSGLESVTDQIKIQADDPITDEADALEPGSKSGEQTTTQDRDSSVIYQRENF